MHFISNFTEALGWALLHFLWQGTVVALLLGLCLRLLRQRSAQVRYALAGLALFLLLGAFLGTLAVVWERPVPAVVPVNRTYETYPTYEPYLEPVAQPTVIPAVEPVLIPQSLTAAASPAAASPPPPPVPFSEKVRPYLPWAVGVWAVGVGCFALRFLFALLAVRGWKRSGQIVVSSEWNHRFSNLCAALEVSRPVKFLSSATIAVPMVIGWLKPVVLVPAGLFTGLTVAQLEAILAHELAHIRRHDYLANLFQHFMETLFFYHPAVWWISSKMREEREHCCDDLAASACGGALGYAKALTALEELRGVAPALSISASGGWLLARIRRIIGQPEEKSRSWPLGLLALLTLAIAIPWAIANPKEEGRPAPLETEKNSNPNKGGETPLLERGAGLQPVSPEASPAEPTPEPAKDQPTVNNNISTNPASAKASGLQARATLNDPSIFVPAVKHVGVEPMAGQKKAADELMRKILGVPETQGPRASIKLKVQYAGSLRLADAREEVGRGAGLQPAGPDASPAEAAPDPTKSQPTVNNNISTDPVSATANGRDAHATNVPGTWALAGGVVLHLYGEVFHGSDVNTTAILSWPAAGNRPAQYWFTGIANDAFAARSLYAVAWDAAHAELWIASRDVGSTAQNAAGKPIANRFKRVDFSNPNLITETYSNGWPKEHPPSAEVMSQMATLMEVPQDPQPEASTLYSWSTTGNPERINLANVQNLSVVQGKDGKLTVSLQSEKKSASMDELSQTIKALALDWETKHAATIGDLQPTQRVTIAGDDISADALQKIIQGCTKANFGPLASGTGVPPVSPDAPRTEQIPDSTKGEPTPATNISPDPASAKADGRDAHATASLAEAQYLEASALAADGEKLLEAKDNTAAYYKFKDAAKLLDTLKKNHPNMRAAEVISTREKLKQLTENALRGEIVKRRPMMKIRGVNLADFPGQTDASKFPEVLEPYPGKPEIFRERKDVFSVVLGDRGPSIYYKAGSDHFYFKVWNYPHSDLYYGPIPGHPSRLGLAAWMREPAQVKRPDKMLYVASEMMKSGDETLAEIALGWLSEVQQGTPRSYERAVDEVKTWLAAHPDSKFATTCRETLAKLSSTADRIAAEWDKARPILPDDRYQAGELVAADIPKVAWGKANPVGLSLGVAQLDPMPSYKFGEDIKLASIYLRNEGQKPISFSYSLAPRNNFHAQIHGPIEEISSTGIIMDPAKEQHCRLEPGRAIILSASYQLTILAESEREKKKAFIPARTSTPSKRLPTNPIYVYGAGDCKLRLICNLSGYDVLDESGQMHPTPAGEWTGRLAAADIPIKILEQDAGSPAPLEGGAGLQPASPSAAPTEPDQDPTKERPAHLEILKNCTYKFNAHITIIVTSVSVEGSVQNTLKIQETDEKGKVVTDTCALPYGEGSWALLVSTNLPKGTPGTFQVCMASTWGVQRYAFDGSERAREGKPGFDDSARWQATVKQLETGELPQFPDDAEIAWAREIIPKLKPASVLEPWFEVRLVAADTAFAEMIRPTISWHGVGSQRLARFVPLGERLLQDEEIEAQMILTSSTSKRAFGATNASKERYARLREKFAGRKAALISEGQVVATWVLDPKNESFVSTWVFDKPKRKEEGRPAPLVNEKPNNGGGTPPLLEPGTGLQPVSPSASPTEPAPEPTKSQPAPSASIFPDPASAKANGLQAHPTADFAKDISMWSPSVKPQTSDWVTKEIDWQRVGAKPPSTERANTVPSVGNNGWVFVEDPTDPHRKILAGYGAPSRSDPGSKSVNSMAPMKPNPKEEGRPAPLVNEKPNNGGGTPPLLERGTGLQPVSPDAPPTEAAPEPTKSQPTPSASISPDPASAKADGLQARATLVPFTPTPPDALNLRIADNLSLLSPRDQPKASGWLLEEGKGSLMEMIQDEPRGLRWLEWIAPKVESFPINNTKKELPPILSVSDTKDLSRPSNHIAPIGKTPGINYAVEREVARMLNFPATNGSPLGDYPSPNDPRMSQIRRATGNLGGVPNSGPAAQSPRLSLPGASFGIISGSVAPPSADPFAPPSDPVKLAEARERGIEITVTDTTGKPLRDFRVIAGVPSSVSDEFEKAHNVKVANWQSHTLHVGHRAGLIWPLDKAYDTMALRIEADGYVPQMVAGLDKKKGPQELSFKLEEDKGVSGSVILPDGKTPAKSADVVLAMIRRNFRYVGKETPSDLGNLAEGESTLREAWDRPRNVNADAGGKFTLPTEIDPTAVVIIYHQDGVLEIPYAKWRENPDVILQPWGRIQGRVQWGDVKGAGETIDLSANHADAYGYPDIISQRDSTTADAEGNFVFERVLPGRAQLSIPQKMKNPQGGEFTIYQDGMIAHADVKAPQTEVTLGGVGRTVKGQLTGREKWDGVTFHFHPTAPHIGFAGDGMMWQAWHDFQKSPKGPVFFRNGLKVNVDGSFAIPGMLPGRYQLFFSKEGEKSHVASSQFTVEAEKPNVKPETQHLPEIKAHKEERGAGLQPASPEASPAEPTPDPTKDQPAQKTNASPDPASVKAGGLQARATGVAKPLTFAEHCKKVAAGKGVANDLNAITAWGTEQQGLQAGLVMLGKAVWGEPCDGWIVVRNTSADESREFVLCQSSNTLHFLAEDAQGHPLTCQDWLGKLFGNDAQIPKALGPGEQLEFPIDDLTISQFADHSAPSILLPAKETTCKLWFDLDQIIRLQTPIKSFTTGKVLMNMVQEPKAEVIRREDIAKALEQTKAIPKVELLQDAEGAMLVITRGVQRVRIYSSEPLKHTLTVDTRPRDESWSLYGDIIVEHKDGTVSKLPTNWASDRSQDFAVDGNVFLDTFQKISAGSWPRLVPDLFLRLGTERKVVELPIHLKENALPLIRDSLVEEDRMAAKYALSRALAKEKPRGVIEWQEKQPDGEKMLKLKISKDGKIRYLPSPDQLVERQIDPADLKELREWMKGVKQRFPEPKDVTRSSNGNSSFSVSIPLFIPNDSHFSLIEHKVEGGKNSTSFRTWPANDKVKNISYEQIKARLLELVK